MASSLPNFNDTISTISTTRLRLHLHQPFSSIRSRQEPTFVIASQLKTRTNICHCITAQDKNQHLSLHHSSRQEPTFVIASQLKTRTNICHCITAQDKNQHLSLHHSSRQEPTFVIASQLKTRTNICHCITAQDKNQHLSLHHSSRQEPTFVIASQLTLFGDSTVNIKSTRRSFGFFLPAEYTVMLHVY